MTHATHSQRAPKPVGLYPHARRVGNLLFLSGVGPRRPGAGADHRDIPGVVFGADGKVASHDIEVQTLAVFDNVRLDPRRRWLASWDRLVDVTVFLTDMAARLQGLQQGLGRALRHPSQPALPHHGRGPRVADADRDRTQVHRHDRLISFLILPSPPPGERVG